MQEGEEVRETQEPDEDKK